MSLPPLWALGNHQSRWGYVSADEILGLAREFRERDIPCDCFHLDIEYMDGYRVFTWDAERYPDPAGLISELAEQGFRAVTIVDPGVKVDEGYAVYTEGRERGLFCQTVEGDEYRNVVWPGVCAFPDFTNPRHARAGGATTTARCSTPGVAGVWCDMDEPALFIPFQSTMPEDVVHPGNGEPRLHGQVHNLYGSQMARAAREGLERLRPDRRPFVITRAGLRRPAAPRAAVDGRQQLLVGAPVDGMPQLQNLGLSGVGFCGVDVGGFYGDTNPELLARWTEFGIVQPFCRNHSHMDTVPQEPWAFGEPWRASAASCWSCACGCCPTCTARSRSAARTGAPILRPLLFDHPGRRRPTRPTTSCCSATRCSWRRSRARGIEHRHVYLPAGTWVHWWTRRGDRRARRTCSPTRRSASPALYARANAAIPLWPVMQSTAAGPPPELRLRIACAPGRGGVRARALRGRRRGLRRQRAAQRALRRHADRARRAPRRLRAAGARGDRARAARRRAGHERARRRRAGRGPRGGRRAGGGARGVRAPRASIELAAPGN